MVLYRIDDREQNIEENLLTKNQEDQSKVDFLTGNENTFCTKQKVKVRA